MNAKNLRHLKHELRTPVNHILGYSELMLENAADSGDNATAGLAKDIIANGRVLANLVERNLLFEADQLDQAQIETLRRHVFPVIQEILQVSSPRPELVTADLYAQDLARIREAAARLLMLVQLPNGHI